MIKYIKYNIYTGAIIGYGGCPSSQDLVGMFNEGFIVTPHHFDITNKYVDLQNKSVCDMKLIPLSYDRLSLNADGIDSIIFTYPEYGPNNIVLNAVMIRYNYDVYMDYDRDFKFSTIEPGIHTIEFKALNYLPTKLEITAV